MARATRSSVKITETEASDKRLGAKLEGVGGQGARVKQEDDVLNTSGKTEKETRKRRSPVPISTTPSKRVKVEDEDGARPSHDPHTSVEPLTTFQHESLPSPLPDALHAKKWKAYAQYTDKSPFPDFPSPTVEECRIAHRILIGLHGAKVRPKQVTASATRAGCGDSPSVLDALVRTILSQNTSDINSTRAKRSMDRIYGGSDEWEKIADGGTSKLQDTIKCGGLSVVKSRVIMGILEHVKDKYGVYSLDHLFNASNEEAMRELIGFPGVGPKTASCVLLFCLQRDSFAVDTHVWRITGLLGWRPKSATRDETHAHLDMRIPDEEKYGLHILLVKHGKDCDECKAGGKNAGKCELRRAFRQGQMKKSESE